jgi:hypothetical protein
VVYVENVNNFLHQAIRQGRWGDLKDAKLMSINSWTAAQVLISYF